MAVPDRLSAWAVPDEPPSDRHRTQPRRSPRSRAARVAAAQRMRLIRRRRLDLLLDGVLGLVLAIFVLTATAGLGVVALLTIPVALGLLISLLVERRRRMAHSPVRRQGERRRPEGSVGGYG